MLENSPLDRAESATAHSTMFYGPIEAVQTWLPVMSAAAEWNGKIFEIAAAANQHWLDFTSRRLAASAALPQHFSACNSFQDVCRIYADFLQKAVADYHAEIVKRDVRAVNAVEAELHCATPSAIKRTGDSRQRNGDGDHHA